MPMPAIIKSAIFHTLRTGFRLAPMPIALRDKLRQQFLDKHADLVPAGPSGQLIEEGATEHRPRRNADPRAIGYLSAEAGTLPAPLPATLIAFYLPQFHPIEENDAWWGTGFTEWRNVSRALPQFEGHQQPRLPGELGFYDLRLPHIMRQQMKLASDYGISAFCIYFYWFAGKTLLEEPLRQWLDDPTLDLPICLCWANENWSRRWDGRSDDVLIQQGHSPEDDLAFIAYIAKYLRDPRYLKVNGRPLLMIYRPGLLPDPAATAVRWREWCRDHNVGEIELAYVQSFDRVDPRRIGFDSAVAFAPNNTQLKPITARQRLLNPDFRGQVYDWRELAAEALAQHDPGYQLYPCVNPGWDNEARRSGCGRTYIHASPRGFRDWLSQSIHHARRRQPKAPLVFINAWNEWAEGAVLEPDARLGHAWLDATRQALNQAANKTAPSNPRPCALVHVWYPELLPEIVQRLRASGLDWRLVITTAPEREHGVLEAMRHSRVEAEVHVAENRGRDILPFLRLANRLLDEGVECILKLHTKRSTHRRDGDSWRLELLDRLLAPERAQMISAAFIADPQLGLVFPEGHLQPLSYFWGANRENVRYLATRIGLSELDESNDPFVAGSMFWIRPKALRLLLDTHLGEWEFEPEEGQLDGTLAHAVERIILLSAHAGSFKSCSAASMAGQAEPMQTSYAYARRN